MPIRVKRQLTNFDVAAVVSELQQLKGWRLSNVYDMPRGFLFRFKGRGDARVAIVPGERIHLTGYDVTDKGMPSPLVMGIRKYIREAVLEDVEQAGFDRIAFLRFSRRGEKYMVAAEVLPRGVLVLVDDNGVTLQASEQREMRDRIIKRGLRYEPPPLTGVHPLSLSVDELKDKLREAGGEASEAVRVIARLLGYPGEVVEEAFARLGLPVDAAALTVAEKAEGLVEVFQELYRESNGSKGFIVYSQDGSPLTVTPFEPRGITSRYGLKFRVFESFSRAVDEFFVEELRRLESAKLASQLEAERQRLRASLERARANLEELRRRLERVEEIITVLGENISYLYEVYECVQGVRRRAGWDYVVGNCPGVVDVDPSRGVVLVQVAGRLVELDVRYDPSRFLVELSKRAGELRAKIERGEKAVADIEGRLAELEERIRKRLSRAHAMVRRREWYERYHWLVTRNGFLAIGGRDASQNESIVKRYLNDKRIFMHADVHGAPIVIVFVEGREPPESDLRDAAVLTAAYSKAWKGGVGAVDVYWVWGSQVSKSPPPGEYLARGAFMVYGRRNYIRGVELRLGLGVGVEDGSPVVIVGPPDLVERRSLVYAVLVPGDEDPSKLASRLRRVFRGKTPSEYQGVVEAVTVEELRLRIPGRARVIYVGRGRNEEQPRPVKILPGAPQE